MKKLITAVLFLITLNQAFAQQSKEINWISFDQLDSLYKENPKPILVDLYTTWCGWCKKMDNDTYRNKKLVEYVNQNFYAIKFDAEYRKKIQYNGRTFSYEPRSRVNGLALALTNALSFPTTILIYKLGETPAPISGYLSAKQLEGPLKYYGSRSADSMSFQQFSGTIKKNW